MLLSYATRRERWIATFLSATLALLLASGFIPTAVKLFRLGWESLALSNALWMHLGEMASFPLLSALFFCSIPRRSPPTTLPVNFPFLWQISLLPLLISFVFGLFHPAPPLWTRWHLSSFWVTLSWYSLFVPIGEEFLFRGWFYEIVDRCALRKIASFTDPLPLSLWMSSLAFALWHTQNLNQDSFSWVTFQVVTTFFTGLWLGYLRWATGKLLLPILGHIAINFLSNLL